MRFVLLKIICKLFLINNNKYEYKRRRLYYLYLHCNIVNLVYIIPPVQSSILFFLYLKSTNIFVRI